MKIQIFVICIIKKRAKYLQMEEKSCSGQLNFEFDKRR